MKKVSIILILIIIAVAVFPVLTSCDNENYRKFQYYYFDDSKGNYNSANNSITIDESESTITEKFGLLSTTKSCKIEDNKIIVNNEDKYYYSQFFIANKEELKGVITLNENNSVDGLGIIGDSYLLFSDGKIYDIGKEVGDYEVVNNYITINLDGAKRTYVIMTDSSQSSGEGYLFDKFYSNVKILSKKVDNTGFEVKNNVLTNVVNKKIEIIPTIRDYKYKDISFEVIDHGGFTVYLNSECEYEIVPITPDVSDKIIIAITVDGIRKVVEFKPVLFAFDKEILQIRRVGDCIDFNSDFYYNSYNFPIEKSLYSVSVIGGKNLVDVEKNMVTFLGEGNVTVRLTASFTIDGNNYLIQDETTIKVLNISNESIKEN